MEMNESSQIVSKVKVGRVGEGRYIRDPEGGGIMTGCVIVIVREGELCYGMVWYGTLVC